LLKSSGREGGIPGERQLLARSRVCLQAKSCSFSGVSASSADSGNDEKLLKELDL